MEFLFGINNYTTAWIFRTQDWMVLREQMMQEVTLKKRMIMDET